MKLSFNVIGIGEVANIELKLDIEQDGPSLPAVEEVRKVKGLIEKGVKWMSKKWVGGMVA